MSEGFVESGGDRWIYKDPDAVKTYSVDWSGFLGEGGAIAAAVWTVPAGLTKVADAVSDDGTVATVKLSGGSLSSGRAGYRVTCRITSVAGEVEDWSFRVVIREQ